MVTMLARSHLPIRRLGLNACRPLTSSLLVRNEQPLPKARSVSTVADVASSLATGPYLFMTTLHQLGLPWWAVFPASALAIRTLVILPLFQIPFRKALSRRVLLTPLIQARVNFLRTKQKKLAQSQGSRSSLLQSLTDTRMRAKVASKLGDQYGAVPRPILTKVASFVVLIIAAEAIRRLCGLKEGLLALIMDSFANAIGFDTIDGHEEEASSELATAHEDDRASEVYDEWYEPSLKTGGIPTWCPDLTSPDPTLILPVLFAATFAASVFFAPRAAQRRSLTTLTRTSNKVGLTNAQRTMLSLAVLTVFPALKMPSGLLLYLISNMGVNALHLRYLAKKYPLPSPLTACRNPITSYTVTQQTKTR